MTLIAQFIGFVFLLFMAMAGFWSLTFLILIAHYWAIMGPLEFYGKKAKSEVDQKESYPPRAFLFQQEGIDLLWKKEA